MKNNWFEKSYSVNSINININKKLGLFGVLGILQDVAALHADELGVGYEKMVEDNAFWVLTRQKLEMKRWPRWQEDLRVLTWTREPQGMTATRDFELFIGEEKIGECAASFMVLDGATRRPVRPNLGETIRGMEFRKSLDINPDKVDLPDKMEIGKILEVRNSDLDMNNHVNNTKYAQWILDSIPIEYHRSANLLSFEINFLAETRLGDEIEIYNSQSDGGACPQTYFKGVRRGDGKVVFAAKLLAKI